MTTYMVVFLIGLELLRYTEVMKLFKRKSPARSDAHKLVDDTYKELSTKIANDLDHADQNDVATSIMYGYALDIVDGTKKNWNIDLDFSDQSVKQINDIVMMYHRDITDAVPDELAMENAKTFGAYVGTVAAVLHGWKWAMEVDESANTRAPILVDDEGAKLYIVQKVAKELRNGHEDSVWDLYNVYISKIAKAISLEELKAKVSKTN